ncbi:MAG: alpha/beta fold hydrolase [Myxococcota bacterium]
MNATTSAGPRLVWELQGSGPPVALVMGLGMPGRIWAPVRAGLVGSHAVLTYDHRGIGGSELPERPYRMADLGDDLARVLDAAGWESAHVVGVSMGGMAAQEFALRHRGRARSLTLIATHSGGRTAPIPGPRGVVRVLQSRVGSREARTRAFLRLLYPRGSGVTQSDAVDNMVAGAFDPRHQAAVRLQLRAVLGHRTTERLAELEGLPTLVVRPGRDLLCRPGHSDRLARAIPGAVLERFDDAGHGIVAQSSERLAASIAAHIQRAGG